MSKKHLHYFITNLNYVYLHVMSCHTHFIQIIWLSKEWPLNVRNLGYRLVLHFICSSVHCCIFIFGNWLHLAPAETQEATLSWLGVFISGREGEKKVVKAFTERQLYMLTKPNLTSHNTKDLKLKYNTFGSRAYTCCCLHCISLRLCTPPRAEAADGMMHKTDCSNLQWFKIWCQVVYVYSLYTNEEGTQRNPICPADHYFLLTEHDRKTLTFQLVFFFTEPSGRETSHSSSSLSP